ncbi:hypothetical protein ACTXQV_74180, partial [Klebsiella pneumoniae]
QAQGIPVGIVPHAGHSMAWENHIKITTCIGLVMVSLYITCSLMTV